MLRALACCFLLLAPVVFGGCGTGGKALGAAANVGLGAAVAGARRAAGACYTPCDPNSTCNPTTGLCEPNMACGGRCREGEFCDTSQSVARCLPIAEALRVQQSQSLPPPPVLIAPPPPVSNPYPDGTQEPPGP